MKILLKNGHIIDPANNIDEIRDILVDNSKIARVARNIANGADQVIDCTDKIVMPGLIDMHVHLREPGREDKETVLSGTKAAAKGGITTVLAMPNTQPTIDCVENIRLLSNIIKETANVNVLIVAAITKGRLGRELTDMPRLKKAGAVAISDDGSSVDSDELFLKALKKANEAKLLMICHSEDRSLSANGVVNLGQISTRLGLRGVPNDSEYRRVQRDIQLAEKCRCPVHIAHVSCSESVEIICKAKKRGVKVSAETAPHYFALSEEEVLGYDTNMKMNPPLRSKTDVEAIKQGLLKGAIDAIASDHAPHTISEKEIEFDRAEFGVIGLETGLSVGVAELVMPGLLSWAELVKKMSFNPAKILGIDKGTLGQGKIADIIIIDPQREWLVKREDFVSKSKNSSFIGRQLKGLVEYTICGGKIVYKL